MSEYMDVRTYEQMKYNADCFQAVWDELQEVRAERDRLREDYAEAQAGWDKVSDECDRLREELERIAAQHGWCTEVQTHVLARRALEGTSDE